MRSSAWHPRQLGPRTGRTFVVTGANSGIGLEVTRDLVRRGAHVVMAVRDTARGAAVASQLDGPGTTTVLRLDLADLDQIPELTRALLTGHDEVAALVANAGIMGGPLRRSPQGHELQMATNHLGHAALIAGLWPLLEASRSRLVLVTSGEARDGHLSPATTRKELLDPDPYDGRQAYRNSKQANLLFAQELHRRSCATGSAVSAVAAHPGAAATGLLARQLQRAGRPRLAGLSRGVTCVILPSARAGARSTLRTLDPDTPSGALVGPARFGQLHGPPQLLDVYDSASDPATAARLWQLTQDALGTPLPF
ncbi:SDR family NAD(P)-dependent oxidoreductase [Egicoccus sp. AB-alg2]|uniref:SDR family NAD(P)-dependent oxidoreductase n=1 Tax=Egicoccus sp. AB-alg2 TaxID=3242693 RepID=UPI00359DAB8E